jgi:hypothetical protein
VREIDITQTGGLMQVKQVLAVVMMMAWVTPCVAQDVASETGRVAGESVALAIFVFILVLAFMTLSLRYGAALRKRKRMGAWLAGGGHALAVGCGVVVGSTGLVGVRMAAGVLGAVLLLIGHIGLWIVVLGSRPGKSRLTFDVGSLREESPAMHALAQGTVILLGLIVFLGGAGWMLAVAFGG